VDNGHGVQTKVRQHVEDLGNRQLISSMARRALPERWNARTGPIGRDVILLLSHKGNDVLGEGCPIFIILT
jgi:hypothetical protein